MTRYTEFPDDYRLTTEDLRDEYLGEEHETELSGSGDHWECDWCSIGCSYKGGYEDAAFYFVDDVLGDYSDACLMIHDQRPMMPMAIYCKDCAEDRLLYPCKGYMEARVRIDLDAERCISRFEFTDISPHDDGIPWDPKDVLTEVCQAPFDVIAAMGPEFWGPENAITILLSAGEGIDIRDLVNYEGEIDRKKLGRARKVWNDFQQERMKYLQEGGHSLSRRKFRDHVRGDDDA